MKNKDEMNGKRILKNIFASALKLPFIYFLIGIILIALAYVDNFFPLTKFKHIFDLTTKLGNIFLSFAALVFLYRVLALIVLHQEKKIRSSKPVASMILKNIRKAFRIMLWLALIDIVIIFLSPSQFYLSLANDLLKTIIIGAIGWIIIQIIYTFEAAVHQKLKVNEYQDPLHGKAVYTKVHILRNIATVVVVLITIAVMLMSFRGVRNIGISLLASAGFLTAIVGLAAQKTLFSLFSGLHIALSQPIKIGDIVVIDNKTGRIEEITFTFVVLKLESNRRMIVPISNFLEKTFENWSQDGEGMQSSIHIYVDYLMPVQPLREHFSHILSSSKNWDGLCQELSVAAINERCVDLELLVSANHIGALFKLKAEVREKMLAFIRENYPNYFPRLSQE